VLQRDRSAGKAFADPGVVAAYIHRPDYPAALYAALLRLMPSRSRALDLGTGPGKMARMLAPHVDEMLAVDPSSAMLRLAAELDAGAHPNIRWINATAESLALDAGSIDLAVAGAAIHWMDASIVFPKLARALVPGGRVAIVEGDSPSSAPWLDAHRRVLRQWVTRLGGVWDGPDHRSLMGQHRQWLEVEGEATFSAEIRQSLHDFIACEHSRATWSRACMGDLAAAFDADLRAALEPWTADGALMFSVVTKLTYGRPSAHRSAGQGEWI
jgi:ubiquinone/menaquinone biosynthesis C-methylase UbiE